MSAADTSARTSSPAAGSRSRFFRFSLRGLLLFMLLISLPLAWRGNTFYVARQRRAALRLAVESGADVTGEREHFLESIEVVPNPTWQEILWGDAIGDSRVTMVDFHPISSRCTDAGAERLVILSELKTIGFAGQPISDRGLKAFARLRELRALDLSGTKVTDQTLEVLAQLPALERLNLSLTGVSDMGLQHLTRCRNLKSLELLDTPVTVAGVDRFRESAPQAVVQWREAATPAHRDALAQLLQLGARITWPQGATSAATQVTIPFNSIVRWRLRPLYRWRGTEADLARLSDVTGRLSVVIEGRDYSDAEFRAILQVPQLRELHLRHDFRRGFNRDNILALTELHKLESLSIAEAFFEDQDLSPLQELNVLQLWIHWPLNLEQMETLSPLFPKLDYVELSDISLESAPLLQKLNCRTLLLNRLSYPVVAEVFTQLKSNASLRHLAITNTITTSATRRRLMACKQLKKLYLDLEGHSPEEAAHVRSDFPGCEVVTLPDLEGHPSRRLETLRAWLNAEETTLSRFQPAPTSSAE